MEVIKWDLITFFVNFLWYSLFYSEFKVSVVQVLFCTSFWLVILRFMMRMTTDFMKRFQLENFMWVIFIISFWPFICRCRRCLQSKWIDLYSVIHFLCIKNNNITGTYFISNWCIIILLRCSMRCRPTTNLTSSCLINEICIYFSS